MARRSLADPSLRPLVDAIAREFLRLGSVNAVQGSLTATLAPDQSEGWIYPNRIHTLLSDDATRALNTASIQTMELAVGRLGAPGEVQPEEAERRSRTLRAWRAGLKDHVTAPQERLTAVAKDLGFPPAAVRVALADANEVFAPEAGASQSGAQSVAEASTSVPDWSFQDDAFQKCTSALRSDVNRKVGLVLPTGGGKTRVALRIALGVLSEAPAPHAVVLWVTHRRRLKSQALRELQRAVNEGTPELPDHAVALLEQRIRVCMVGELGAELQAAGDSVALVVVDEAHHAAAPSYAPVFERVPLRGLFLTATPNRTDDLPIGIDEIAYSITYRELFDRGVIIEPDLETRTIEGFRWDSEDRVVDLADAILDRAESDARKALVAVSRVDYAEALHEVLCERLADWEGHVLTEQDIGFVHGDRSSTGEAPQQFLDEFAAQPRGVVVATTQLLGEGFDDPLVDCVFVTYPTGSIVELMQVAGRCMRYAPGKTSALIVQVRDSALAYHWEQRWLYQDISDLLRPRLEDLTYASSVGLVASVEQLLGDRHVQSDVAESILEDLRSLPEGAPCHLLLSGLPYDGADEDFVDAARWNAVLVKPDDRALFLRVFNEFCAREAEVNDTTTFLRNYVDTADPRWGSYHDMLTAMSYARRDLRGEAYVGASSRPTSDRGSSWLTYISFEFEPSIPESLAAFLADAVNGTDLAQAYAADQLAWRGALKLPLPLGGTLALLLDDTSYEWFVANREFLRARVLDAAAADGFTEASGWRGRLLSAPLPMWVIERFEAFLSDAGFDQLALSLSSDGGPAATAG